MASVRYIIDEWSVPDSDAVNYAQIKDLIWQIAAPLGLSMLGFSTVERALREDPGDIDALGNRALFAQAGEDTGALLEQFLKSPAGCATDRLPVAQPPPRSSSLPPVVFVVTALDQGANR